ncbi:M14 family zinc carboxypeptidase [Aestuariibacter salexigens]|uniref:M14 family zinc carboxypeptidase n=1 Tax=Aestuariibacter salexigens TaxID=226010 RepID=UPI00047E9AE1|nr:M14 family zinc carboxypeptidase [Aestuariibacter salexigens]
MHFTQFTRSIFALLIISLTSSLVYADPKNATLWPEVIYDASIPTFKQVLGYEVGERITSHHDMLRYFDALQQAAPDRIQINEYARSWQGRSLIYAVVAKPENLAALDDITEDIQALTQPGETNKQQAADIARQRPAFVWLQYGVHGNEISSTDAAMYTAYHLLAAQDDEITKQVLANTVVFLDPLQNPDGRARFTSFYYDNVGIEHSPDRLSVEHNEPWPRGRTNHYLFDMNRDWLAITQPETKGKIAALNHFKPQVVVDLHEMSSDRSYYFAPAARPFNPHMTDTQIANMNAIGRNNGAHFDRFGFDFFTREVYDAFYPGYGDSWPAFYGASASTYEVGSTRGEKFLKRNGELFTYWDTVQRHFVASISTLEGAAGMKEKLLKDFYQYQLDAIEEGKDNDARTYILPGRKNREGTHRLATLMAEHGVDVKRASSSFKACSESYEAGSFIIDTAQPRGRYVTTTFADQVDMAADFLQEQERRRARNLGDQIYDVTGWSLPMMFNVETVACDRAVSVQGEFIAADLPLEGEVVNPEASVGYVVAWGDMAAGRFLTAALRAGITLKSADEAFTLNEQKRYPAGSLIIERRSNDADLSKTIEKLAQQTGALVEGVDSSWVTEGPSFGSPRSVTMTAPRVAIAWGSDTSSLSAGNSRFVIEHQLNYPTTAMLISTLATSDLSQYDVIILPEGSYSGSSGSALAKNLKGWMQQGGVLLTLGRANRFATDADFGLLDIKREYAYRADGENKKDNADDKSDRVEGTLFTEKSDLVNAAVEPETSPDSVSGMLANVEVDQEHWLTAGVSERLVTLAYGNDIYTPIKLDSGKNLAWFVGADELLASGYLWEENKKQLAYKPLLIHQPVGEGMIIAFTQSPTSRAFLEGMNVLLTNSIFRAAAHAKN